MFALEFTKSEGDLNPLLFRSNCFDDLGYQLKSKLIFVENSNILKVRVRLNDTILKFFTFNLKYQDNLLPMCPLIVRLDSLHESNDLPQVLNERINLDNVDTATHYPLLVGMVNYDPPQNNKKDVFNYVLNTKFKVNISENDTRPFSSIEELEEMEVVAPGNLLDNIKFCCDF